MIAIAWLVRNCPNFHFMPSLRYDRVFTEWADDGNKMSPEFWSSVGFSIEPMELCNESIATHWLVGNDYAVFDSESANAALSLGKSVTPIRKIPTERSNEQRQAT